MFYDAFGIKMTKYAKKKEEGILERQIAELIFLILQK